MPTNIDAAIHFYPIETLRKKFIGSQANLSVTAFQAAFG